MTYLLLNEKDIVMHKFDARDETAARAATIIWSRQNMMKVTLVCALRTITPISVPPSVSMEDKPA